MARRQLRRVIVCVSSREVLPSSIVETDPFGRMREKDSMTPKPDRTDVMFPRATVIFSIGLSSRISPRFGPTEARKAA